MAFDIKKVKLNLPGKAGTGVAGIRNILLFILLILSLIATVVIFTKVLINEAHRTQYISLTDELRLLSQQMLQEDQLELDGVFGAMG